MQRAAFDEAMRYYAERYDVLARHPLAAERKILLKDHLDDASRSCRYCSRTAPTVSFANVAHAVPEFLGNRSVLSLNECDECNHYLANNYEDHLGKWSLFARATSNVAGKNKPKFKNPQKSLQIEAAASGPKITITDPDLLSDLMTQDGPYTFTLPADATSQPYVPIRAAMAMIKIACSVCPTAHFNECVPAVSWLMGQAKVEIPGLPVLYSFTPGPINDKASEVILLRRKVDEPIPFLWCLVQFRHHRLQVFVPFCPADAWMAVSGPITISCIHFPSRFGPDWQYGDGDYKVMNWSGTEAVRTSATASFHINKAVRVDDGNLQEGE